MRLGGNLSTNETESSDMVKYIGISFRDDPMLHTHFCYWSDRLLAPASWIN